MSSSWSKTSWQKQLEQNKKQKGSSETQLRSQNQSLRLSPTCPHPISPIPWQEAIKPIFTMQMPTLKQRLRLMRNAPQRKGMPMLRATLIRINHHRLQAVPQAEFPSQQGGPADTGTQVPPTLPSCVNKRSEKRRQKTEMLDWRGRNRLGTNCLEIIVSRSNANGSKNSRN